MFMNGQTSKRKEWAWSWSAWLPVTLIIQPKQIWLSTNAQSSCFLPLKNQRKISSNHNLYRSSQQGLQIKNVRPGMGESSILLPVLPIRVGNNPALFQKHMKYGWVTPEKQVLPAQSVETRVQTIQCFLHFTWATDLELSYKERPIHDWPKMTCVQI